MDAIADGFDALVCPLCGHETPPALEPTHCPDCDALLEPHLDVGAVDVARDALSRRPFTSMWRYGELLPIDPSAAVTLEEGATPLVGCPRLAETLGVGSLAIKLEGANPTGTFKDRGQTLAMSVARAAGAADVALASAGNAGHAAAAYAARAGLDAHVFLPARAGFDQKALVNVHGADLTVVEGRLLDAGRVYTEALEDHPEWFPIGTNEMAFRRAGKKTMYYEIAEQRGWSAPDAVVYPTGGGVGLLGMARAAAELRALGWLAGEPAFYAAQSTGCMPVVEAFEAGRERIEPVDQPDTICGGIEVPTPGADREMLTVLRDSDGGAVATDDDAILDGALDLAATEGLGIEPTSAATISGIATLAERGELGPEDDVVAVATGTALKGADVLRGQLMSHGE